METLSLKKYVEQHGQTATAERLGVTQGSVWQMLKRGRAITVVVADGEVIDAYESKRIGRFRAVPVADSEAA